MILCNIPEQKYKLPRVSAKLTVKLYQGIREIDKMFGTKTSLYDFVKNELPFQIAQMREEYHARKWHKNYLREKYGSLTLDQAKKLKALIEKGLTLKYGKQVLGDYTEELEDIREYCCLIAA